MKQYVVGFAFSRDKKDIVLIEKQKPDWQKGKFNGIGGKIEPEESPIDAMIREFNEETGVIIDAAKDRGIHGGFDTTGWHHFSTVHYKDCILFCFRSFTNIIYKCETMEQEKVHRMAVDTALNFKPVIENLQVLIRMAAMDEFYFAEINGI